MTEAVTNFEWSIDAESIYQKVLVTFGRKGLKNNVYLVYSDTLNGGFIAISTADVRTDGLDENYEVIGTYDSKPLPRLESIKDDVHAFLNEEAEKRSGVRPELFGFVQASR